MKDVTLYANEPEIELSEEVAKSKLLLLIDIKFAFSND